MSVRFGAQFLYQLQRPVSHNELKRFESVLKQLDSRVESVTASAMVPNVYYPARKPIVLTTLNTLPNTVKNWSANQQSGFQVCQQWEKTLANFGLRAMDDTIVDNPYHQSYAHERRVFNTANPRTWEVILSWLRQVDQSTARQIEQTRNWWLVYPVSLVPILKGQSPPRN